MLVAVGDSWYFFLIFYEDCGYDENDDIADFIGMALWQFCLSLVEYIINRVNMTYGYSLLKTWDTGALIIIDTGSTWHKDTVVSW